MSHLFRKLTEVFTVLHMHTTSSLLKYYFGFLIYILFLIMCLLWVCAWSTGV